MKMSILELEYKNIRKISSLQISFRNDTGGVIKNNFVMMANGTGKHRLTRAHREKQLKMSCQALHNAPPNRT